MLSTCWETGLSCPVCENEIGLGEEMLYGRHVRCAREVARDKREAASASDVLDTAREQLAVRGRIMLSRAQLRELIALVIAANPGFTLVRRPDRQAGPMQWYGRIAGWDPARVKAGLSAPEVAGLWADYLDVGRTPPIRHSDLSAILVLITG